MLAELGLPLLADSREVEGRYLRAFLLELSQELLDVLADVLQLLGRILQLFHEMRLPPGKVGDPMVEAHENVDDPEEGFLGGVVELGELQGPVEDLELGHLLAHS